MKHLTRQEVIRRLLEVGKAVERAAFAKEDDARAELKFIAAHVRVLRAAEWVPAVSTDPIIMKVNP